jgi:hypothetical protein
LLLFCFVNGPFCVYFVSNILNLFLPFIHLHLKSHCGFSDPWSFLVACKKFSCRERWYTNSASLDLDIRRRIIPTVSGLPTLKYFDGSTMSLYRIPSKPCEVNYCRQGSPPNECTTLQGYDPSITNIPESSFEVKLVRRFNSSKVGLFSKVDIDQGSMILQEKSSNSIHFYPTTTSLIYHTADLNPLAKQNLKGMLTVFDRYAFENNLFVSTRRYCIFFRKNLVIFYLKSTGYALFDFFFNENRVTLGMTCIQASFHW